MAFDDYDLGAAFSRIEEELIDSMMRNLGRHLKEEKDEGFDWSQWQAEQLKALDEYRRRNREKFGPQFKTINKRIREAIRHANKNGQKDEEKRILEALAKDKKMQRRYAERRASIEASGDAFFRVNDRKLNALVKATHSDMQKAEHAVLRRSNDQYRKIIFDAQVYANTGAGTVEKAIDMATKDFLSKGIDCIVYSNGARHSISDYADMCIRTAERRAYLMGEGEKRKEWGIPTVIVGKRGTMQGGNHGTACPKCIPWLGKVLIDDVWSGGEAWINGEDRQRSKGSKKQPMGTSPLTGAKYPLMSTAIAEGLYHPRCKDGHTTYFEGLSTPPDGETTKKDIQEAVEAEKEENREHYAQRQAEKYGRLAEYSLDPENRQVYEARAEEWDKRCSQLKYLATADGTAQEYDDNNHIDLDNFRKKYDKILFEDELVGWNLDELRKRMERADYYEDVDEALRIEDIIRRVRDNKLKPFKSDVLEDFLSGMNDMLERFPQIYDEGFLKSIRYDTLDKKALAFVHPGKPYVFIHKRLASKRNRVAAREAGYHEVVHLLENYLGIGEDDKEAEKIVNEAFKRLKIRRNGNDAMDLRISIAGYEERMNPHEIIAYSFSKNYVGKGNDFSREIEKIVLERVESR